MRGGVSKLEWAGDADYLAQATIDLHGGDYADCLVRYVDPDNYYAVRLSYRGQSPIWTVNCRMSGCRARRSE